MNKVLLVGRIVREVEIKTTSSGRNYSYNAIACKREYKNKEGKYESDFIPLTFGETTSVFFGKYVQKGDLVEVIGRWNVRKDGENGTLNECIVDSICLISKSLDNKQTNEEDKKERKEKREQEAKESDDKILEDINNLPDDLPF